ncbi:MAG TPA: hypothetical protein VLV83_23030 [Acidobacteriota bacterium]|nr:hypothetical protein [Acidobacteriota bacterium]
MLLRSRTLWAALMALALFISPLAAHDVEKDTPLDVRLAEPISSERNQAGDTFEALLDEPLRANGEIVAPRGAVLRGEILEAQESGKVKGRAVLRLTLRTLNVGERQYGIDTNDIEIRAKGSKKEDAAVIGGGAGIGAVIGAIIGGGKGAAIGAAIGAGAGTTAVLVTEGDEVSFETEQEFRFFLEEGLDLPAYSGEAELSVDDRVDGYDGGDDRFGGDHRDGLRGRDFPQLGQQIRELSDLSEESLEEGRRLLDNSDAWADEVFALRSFHSSLEIFSEIWQDHSPRELVAAQQLLMRQYENTDNLLRQAAVPQNLWDAWRRVGTGLDDFDRAFEQERRNDFRQGQPETRQSGKLVWSGLIDQRDSITLQGSDVSINHLRGRQPQDTSISLTSALPRQAVRLVLNKLEGRGTVRLLEEPSRWNDYQAVILIEDPDGGADRYEFELTWEVVN